MSKHLFEMGLISMRHRVYEIVNDDNRCTRAWESTLVSHWLAACVPACVPVVCQRVCQWCVSGVVTDW